MRIYFGIYSCNILKYSIQGPTSVLYCLAITRQIWAIWLRSCTTQVERSWDKVTSPKAGWIPFSSRFLSVSCFERRWSIFVLRNILNSSKSWVSDFPLLSSKWARRSNGSNVLSGFSERIIYALVIQSVFSPWIRWPIISYTLQVCSPSLFKVHSTEIFCSIALRTLGVRSRISMDFSKLKFILDKCRWKKTFKLWEVASNSG